MIVIAFKDSCMTWTHVLYAGRHYLPPCHRHITPLQFSRSFNPAKDNIFSTNRFFTSSWSFYMFHLEIGWKGSGALSLSKLRIAHVTIWSFGTYQNILILLDKYIGPIVPSQFPIVTSGWTLVARDCPKVQVSQKTQDDHFKDWVHCEMVSNIFILCFHFSPSIRTQCYSRGLKIQEPHLFPLSLHAELCQLCKSAANF